MDLEQVHGIEVTVVSLNSEPVTVTMHAEDIKKQSEKTAGKMDYAHVQIGYRTNAEPGSRRSYDPEDTVYEAREYLKRKAAESEQNSKQSSEEESQ